MSAQDTRPVVRAEKLYFGAVTDMADEEDVGDGDAEDAACDSAEGANDADKGAEKGVDTEDEKGEKEAEEEDEEVGEDKSAVKGTTCPASS